MKQVFGGKAVSWKLLHIFVKKRLFSWGFKENHTTISFTNTCSPLFCKVSRIRDFPLPVVPLIWKLSSMDSVSCLPRMGWPCSCKSERLCDLWKVKVVLTRVRAIVVTIMRNKNDSHQNEFELINSVPEFRLLRWGWIKPDFQRKFCSWKQMKVRSPTCTVSRTNCLYSL